MIVVERIDPQGGTAHRISIRGHEIVADMSAPDGHDAEQNEVVADAVRAGFHVQIPLLRRCTRHVADH